MHSCPLIKFTYAQSTYIAINWYNQTKEFASYAMSYINCVLEKKSKIEHMRRESFLHKYETTGVKEKQWTRQKSERKHTVSEGKKSLGVEKRRGRASAHFRFSGCNLFRNDLDTNLCVVSPHQKFSHINIIVAQGGGWEEMPHRRV